MDVRQHIANLQQAMEVEAKEVWRMVHASRADGYRLRLGEVTLTELMFYRMRKHWTASSYVSIWEPNEARTGSDWEWFIGSGEKWVSIRVQAKVDDKAGSFAKLGHAVNGQRQIDTLIDPEYSTVCRWIPLYVFYLSAPPVRLPYPFVGEPTEFGCTAVLARDVRQNLDEAQARVPHPFDPRGRMYEASRYLRGSFPWSTIFDGLVDRLETENFEDIIDSLHNLELPEAIAGMQDFWKASVSRGVCADGGLPEYAAALLENRPQEVVDLTSTAATRPSGENSEEHSSSECEPMVGRVVLVPNRETIEKIESQERGYSLDSKRLGDGYGDYISPSIHVISRSAHQREDFSQAVDRSSLKMIRTQLVVSERKTAPAMISILDINSLQLY